MRNVSNVGAIVSEKAPVLAAILVIAKDKNWLGFLWRLGLVTLLLAGDFLVRGAVNLALRLGISALTGEFDGGGFWHISAGALDRFVRHGSMVHLAWRWAM